MRRARGSRGWGGEDGSPEPRVESLYLRQCAACHGEHGDGDGPLSSYLYPPARAFSAGLFSLVSTVNAMPTDDDLAATIRRGMHGTAMPGFAWLSETQAFE